MGTVLRPMLDNQTKRLGKVERRMPGREGDASSELESDLFLTDMSAEGRGNTIRTRAL